MLTHPFFVPSGVLDFLLGVLDGAGAVFATEKSSFSIDALSYPAFI